MYLQQHAHFGQPSLGQRREHADHRALDDVGACPLNRRVDRGAFAALPFGLIGRFDAREVHFSPEQSLRKSGFADMLERFGDVAVDAGKALEIAIDQRLCFVGRRAHAARQTPARDAVEDREIDRLGAPARVAVDLAEEFHGS